jgi:hypothetical protein
MKVLAVILLAVVAVSMCSAHEEFTKEQIEKYLKEHPQAYERLEKMVAGYIAEHPQIDMKKCVKDCELEAEEYTKGVSKGDEAKFCNYLCKEAEADAHKKH